MCLYKHCRIPAARCVPIWTCATPDRLVFLVMRLGFSIGDRLPNIITGSHSILSWVIRRANESFCIALLCLASRASYYRTLLESMELLTMASYFHSDNILRSVLEKPLVTASTTILTLFLVIITLDWLNYQKQRRRLGNIPIVGDAAYLWQRLRWTESRSNLKQVFQRGYNTV